MKVRVVFLLQKDNSVTRTVDVLPQVKPLKAITQMTFLLTVYKNHHRCQLEKANRIKKLNSV